MVRRGLMFLLLTLLVACGGERDLVADAGSTHVVGAAIPPYGPAGGKLAGTYPNPDFAQCDGGEFWQMNDAGTSWVCTPGYAGFPGLVPIDSGTKGQLPTARLVGLIPIDAGTANQLPPSRIVVGSNGQIMQSNTISSLWNTMSGDCTINGSGVVTCTQAQAGELTFGASTGTITGASTATAVGLAQASTSGATAAAMVDTTQTSTNASGTTGNRIFNFAAPTSATAVTPYGRIVAQYAGVNEVEIGYDPYWGSAIFFGTPNTSNAAIYGTSTTTNVNASAVASLILGGATYAVKAVASTSDVTIGSHYNLGMTAVNTGDYGGGQGVFGMSAAATAPTSNPSSGDTIMWSATTGYSFRGHSGTITTIPP